MFLVLLLSKFQNWNNHLDASLYGIKNISAIFQQNTIYIIFHIFQTKTGFPKPLLEQWKNKSGAQWILEHRIVRSFYLLPKFLSYKEKKEYLKSYKMVTFGRHPFVRLVSTYKDKLIDGNTHEWRKMMNYEKNHPYSVKYLLCSISLVLNNFSLRQSKEV